MPIQISSTQAITSDYAHVYLSPHLDDAALSCGGALARFAAAGQPVLVVNVCTASPGAGPFSPFASELHAKWNLPGDEAVARRRAEDAIALETLGADNLNLDLLDAIYRMPHAYGDDVALFDTLAPDDTLAAAARPTLAALAARLPGAIFYAPLGVGGHVDHQAIHAVAAELAGAGATLAYYEDFPYVTVAGALERRLAELGGAGAFAPVVADISATLERKVAAVAAYTSQLDALFGGPDAMAQALTDYALKVARGEAALGERVWIRL